MNQNSCSPSNLKENAEKLNELSEKELISRAKQGDKVAKELLHEKYKKHIIKLARYYANKGTDLEELIQEANVGFLMAIDKFDIEKNIKLNTYSTYWILERIRNAIKRNTKKVSISNSKLNQIQKMKNEYEKLINDDFEGNVYEEISKKFKISPSEVEKLLNLNSTNSIVNIDDVQNYLTDEKNFSNFTTDFEKVDYNIIKEQIQKYITEELTKEESEVIIGYFYENKTINQLSLEGDKSVSKIRELKKSAMNKLRQKLSMEDLKFFN